MGKAILFDLDDTLLDGRLFASAIENTCRAVAVNYGLDSGALLKANGQAFENRTFSFEDWEMGRISGAAVAREIWLRALESINVTRSELVDDLCAHQASFAHASYVPYEDVVPALEQFKAADIAMGIVTNGAIDSQNEKIDAMGIREYFDVIVISAEHEILKPDARLFEITLSALAASSTDVWMVGDNLKTDVLGANSAGIKSVWLNRDQVDNETDINPRHIIRSLDQLFSLLDDD